MLSISVEIPVEGDWPSAEDMDARNAVIDELDESGFGEFVGAGGGLGAMDFQYDVADAEQAKRQVAEVMQRHLPGRVYAVRVRK
jgi:hypothetical protein